MTEDPHKNLVDPSTAVPITAPPDSDRLTAAITYYHEHIGEPPVEVSVNASVLLETEHQPYHRRVACGPLWARVDTGWVPPADVGMVVVVNRPPRGHVQPTEEQRATNAAKVVYVRLGTDSGPGMAIVPGMALPLQLDGQELFIRGAIEGVVAHVTVFGR